MLMRTTALVLSACLFCSTSNAQSGSAKDVEHVMVYHEPGRFGGWPANHGIWNWGDEILVGYARGYYKDLGPERHNIDRERPEEHWLARSVDGGKTWTHELPMNKGQLIPYGPALHGIATPGIAIPELKECEGNIDFSHPDFAFVAKMSDIHAGQSRFYLSQDRGHNWNGPFRLPNFGTPGTSARTDYIVDGPRQLTMLLTVAKKNGREGRVMAVRTIDGAKSWQFMGWVDEEPEGFSIMPATVRLSKSELFTIVRRQDPNKRWNAAYRSLDDGQNWQRETDPVDDLGEGNPPALIKLRDGRLCFAYGYRAAPYSICVKLSSDAGKSWTPPIILRDDGGNRDMGYPRAVQRADGKVVVVYYFWDKKTGPERYIAASMFDPNKF